MKSLEMTDLVQEIGLLIDDWHFTECPHDETGRFINIVMIVHILKCANVWKSFHKLKQKCITVKGV